MKHFSNSSRLDATVHVQAGTGSGRASKRAVRIRLYFVLLAADVACIVLAFVAGALIRHGELTIDGLGGVTACILALYFLSALSMGAYSLEILRQPVKGTARALGSLMLAFALLFLLSYFLKIHQDISRVITGSSFVLALVGVAVTRQLGGDAIKRGMRGQFTTEVLLCDGAPVDVPEGLILIDAKRVGLQPDARDAAMLIRFANLLEGVDRLVISCPMATSRHWSQMLKGSNIRGEILAREYDALAPIGISDLSGLTTLVVSAGPLNIRQRIAKRTFDLALAVPALILLLPVFAMIALLIKIDNKGPAFFKQQRVGRGNGLFEIYKFRTMSVAQSDADGHVSASRNDQRVTRVGRILRQTSLDELPQLLNVFWGSMSIVGPRPHALGSLAGDELFWHVDERYWHRHALKPGITGLAQVRGFRGATDTREDLTSRLRADLEYIAGWSLWRDISIVARTARVLIHPRAY